MSANPGKSTRQRILDCARELVVEEGTGHLTIDRVAERAGISKGAFLYHFKSKQDLMRALIDAYVDHLESNLRNAEEQFRDSPDPVVQGFAAWFRKFSANDGGSAALGVALFAVHAHDPAMLEPVREWYRKLFDRLQQSRLGPDRVTAAVLAIEGLFFLRLFGLDQIDADAKQRVLDFVIDEVTKNRPAEG